MPRGAKQQGSTRQPQLLEIDANTALKIVGSLFLVTAFVERAVQVILGIWGIHSSLWITLFNIGSRIVLLPLVAGLAYEVTVKWAGNHSENPFVKVLLWPGMQLQRLTTREPDDDMVEVAVAALKAVVDREQAEAAAPAEPAPVTGIS